MIPKPNILFLLSDQQRADTLGAVNPVIRTPNLDALAASGTLFSSAYPPTPVCLPCRASLMTGQYPSSHRAAHNNAALRMDHSPLVADILRGAGYYTHMIGKSHVNPCHQPGSPEATPRIHLRDYWRSFRGPWYGFEHADLNVGHSTEAHACGMHYGVWLEDRGVDTGRYFGKTGYYDYGAWDLPEEYHNSRWVAETTVQAMERAADEGRPFYIWSNFQDPHNPYFAPEPWASMYDPQKMPSFGFKPGEPECFADKPPFYNETLRNPGDYAARYSHPEIDGPFNTSALPLDERRTRESAAVYYGMVSLMDKYIGEILAALDRLGMRENTIIVFSSDHGDLLGDHGFWWKGVFPYEECVNVPFIAAWPGHIPPGRRSDALQSLVDLAPTFCAAAGVARHPSFEGVDQLACWRGEAGQARDCLVIEERPHDGPFNQRIFIEGDYKLVYYSSFEDGELYHRRDDPHQVRNLWKDPAHRRTRESLMHRLLREEINRRAPWRPVYR